MAVHYNRPIVNLNRKKKVEPYIRTWFNQAGRKQRRYLARQAKLVRGGTKPMDKLRPVVRCPGQRHNHRQKLGRGFTPEELKEAGFVNILAARTVGITVDQRRKNRNMDTFNENVDRLKEYRSRLVVLPRKAGEPMPGRHGLPDDALKATIEDKPLIHKLRSAEVFKIKRATSVLVE